jgi:hypothetical protein
MPRHAAGLRVRIAVERVGDRLAKSQGPRQVVQIRFVEANPGHIDAAIGVHEKQGRHRRRIVGAGDALAKLS